MNYLGISTIKCLLDYDLSVISANDFFYKAVGYKQEEFFCALFKPAEIL